MKCRTCGSPNAARWRGKRIEGELRWTFNSLPPLRPDVPRMLNLRTVWCTDPVHPAVPPAPRVPAT